LVLSPIGASIAFFSLFYNGVDTDGRFIRRTQSAPNGTIMMVVGAFVIGFSSILTD